MPKYNCTFTIEKDGEEQKKFEVIETESNNRHYLITSLAKKYEGYTINIKRISDSINGKAMTI